MNAYLHITDQAGRRRRVVLDHSPFTIGRNPASSLLLADIAVSKDHASISYGQAGWQITDLGSANGTYIDGQRLFAGDTFPLSDGASIRIGRNSITLSLPAAARQPSRDTANEQLQHEMAGLLAPPAVELPRTLSLADLPPAAPAVVEAEPPLEATPLPQLLETPAEPGVAAEEQLVAEPPARPRTLSLPDLIAAEPVAAVSSVAQSPPRRTITVPLDPDDLVDIAPVTPTPVVVAKVPLTAAAPATLPWWRRLFQRKPRAAVAASPAQTAAAPRRAAPQTGPVPRRTVAQSGVAPRRVAPQPSPAPRRAAPQTVAAQPATVAQQEPTARSAVAAPSRPVSPSSAIRPGPPVRQLRRVPIFQSLLFEPMQRGIAWGLNAVGITRLQQLSMRVLGYTPEWLQNAGSASGWMQAGEEVGSNPGDPGAKAPSVAGAAPTPPGVAGSVAAPGERDEINHRAPFVASLRRAGASPLPVPRDSTILLLEPASRLLSVEPGRRVSTAVTVSSNSATPERIRLGVEGVPAAWVSIVPPILELAADAQGEVQVTITPPRAATSLAGTHDWALVGRAEQHWNDEAVLAGTLTIGVYSEFRAELLPYEAGGWRRAHFTLALVNSSNRLQQFQLAGRDEEDLLVYRFRPRQLEVWPGVTSEVRLEVRPRPWHWLGRPRAYAFSVLATPLDAATPAQEASGRMVQQPALALTCSVLAILLLLLLVLLGPWFGSLYARAPQSTPTAVAIAFPAYPLPIVPEAATTAPTEPPVAPLTALPLAEPVGATAVANNQLPPQPTNAPAPTASPLPTATPFGRLVCLPGRSVLVSGTGPANDGALLYFGTRAVGGGPIDQAGRYSISITVGQERPGVYPVAVRARSTGQELFRGYCIVPAVTPTFGARPPIRIDPAQPPVLPLPTNGPAGAPMP